MQSSLSKDSSLSLISPHGGTLINRITNDFHSFKDLTRLYKIKLGFRQLIDLYSLSCGILSPLEGFMNSGDYSSVINNMSLANGLTWSIPITLSITIEQSSNIKIGDIVAFTDINDTIVGYINVEEKYNFNKKIEAEKIYLTDDVNHPGVAALYAMEDTLLAGKITVINNTIPKVFPQFDRTPAEVREIFKSRGWKTIVAFQTRNPVHRAHEYIQKCAMEIVDGLLLHPLVGETKEDDIPADVRMKCYEELLQNYYPEDRVLLSVLRANMRYAGPKEAIFHAIMRKNFGCTHFIVGRDHAGVGNYYGTYDAQKIFDNINLEKLEIKPLFYDHTFYCTKCEQMVSIKTCPHSRETHVFFSGTKVREMLKAGIIPPKEFTRPEVANILIEATKNEQK